MCRTLYYQTPMMSGTWGYTLTPRALCARSGLRSYNFYRLPRGDEGKGKYDQKVVSGGHGTVVMRIMREN